MGGLSPRFRQDLISAAAEADGVSYVDVQDPVTGTQFRFYDFEYALATQMDGRPIGDVIEWAAESYAMPLTEEGVDEFARQLGELGFLELDAPAAEEAAPTVSHLVNEAVSQVTALPTSRKSGAAAGAYGDFTFRSGEGGGGGEATTADAEWSSDEGARTVSGGDIADLAAFGTLAASAADVAAASPPAAEAMREFNESEPTSHWVPPMGPDHPREPSHWAEHLSDDLAGSGGAAAPGPSGARPGSDAPSAGETLLGFSAAAMGTPPPEPFGKSAPRRARPLAPMTPPPVAVAPEADAGTPPPRTYETPPSLPGPVTPPPSVPFERRQPPAPEQVVMSAFQQTAAAADAAGATPPPMAPSSTRQQFRAPPETPRSSRGPKIAVVVMLVLLIVAAVAYYLWTTSVAAAAVRHVRVLSPKPTAVYRWFDSTGRVAGGESRTLAFEGGGRVTDVLPAGSAFSAGEIIARLQGAALVESDVSRHRARLLFYEQMRDSMRAANNAPELRQAEIKIGIKTDLLNEAERLLAPRVIRPTEAGLVIETLAKPGDTVQPHVAVLKINPGRLRGEFALAPEDSAVARALAFCRVEVAGQAPTASIATTARRGGESSAADSGPPQATGSPRYLDCERRADSTDGDVVVELPAGAAVTVGQPLRLARARFDGVFPIPRGAVVRVDDTDRLFVAAGGMAETRAVTLVEAPSGEDALVAQGLDVGDAVIVDAPADLRDGVRIAVDK